MSTIEERLRERAVETADGPVVRLADVEVALVLARREGMERGMMWPAGTVAERTGRPTPACAYPLPKRTRQVLREEPVPSEGDRRRARYRWVCGLEVEDATGNWSDAGFIPDWDVALMRHAVDLHDKPYRTEECTPDENDPWPPLAPSAPAGDAVEARSE